MPIQTSVPSKKLIYKSNDKFADFNTIFTFPKNCVTSRMVQMSNQNNTFMVACLTSEDPLIFLKDGQISFPVYEKNEMIPLKPIQKLNSFAESSGALVLSHGEGTLEFSRISLNDDQDTFHITRFCQKVSEKPYKKILFGNDSDFYAKTDTQIDVYDFKQISRMNSFMAKGTILDFDSCPRQSNVLAYTDGNLNLIDTRMTGNFKFNPISGQNSIKWNPIVPYWLASSSPEFINIFDIRYNSPIPVVSISHANVHDFCWSTNNCDLILASSRDRRTNLWSLNHSEDNCRLKMTMNRYELGCLTSARDFNNVFYALDDADSLVQIKIKSDYLIEIAPEAADAEFKGIEDALYSGNFDAFMEKLREMSREAICKEDYPELTKLVRFSAPSQVKSITFDEKLVSSIDFKGNFDDFRDLMSQITRSNFIDPFTKEQNEEIQRFIDQLRLKIRIIELITACDFDLLRNLMNLVTESFCKDLNFLDKAQAIKLMSLLLKNDRCAGIQLLSSVSAANPFGAPEIIQIWLWMICYPTIFDSRSFELIRIRPSLSKSIEDLNEQPIDADQEDVTAEMYLERLRDQFYDSLIDDPVINSENSKIVHQFYLNLGNNPLDLERLFHPQQPSSLMADLLEERENALTSICTAETVKNLVEAALKLSSRSFLKEFFLVSFRLLILTEKTPIYKGIQEFNDSIGFSRLKFLLNQNHNIFNDNTAINTIISIVTDHYCSFTEDQLHYLADELQVLIERIDDYSLVNKDFSVENVNNLKLKTVIEGLIDLLQ